MCTDLKEREELSRINCIFNNEVKQSVVNVIADNPNINELELRKLVEQVIEKYFDKTIGVDKMRIMLSARGCAADPLAFLEKSKMRYLWHYRMYPLPRVNSNATLQKIAAISEELEKKINEILKDKSRKLGFCHFYWPVKQKILLEDYGIVWYSPAECNPDIMYD